MAANAALSVLQETLILLVLWLHVWLAPYTKVEESFNLHATHDILLYGLSPATLKNVTCPSKNAVD
jgi:alpha-1,6-mannosyltransferase